MITVSSRKAFLEELSKQLPENSKGVELGVYRGDFSEMILEIVKPRCLFLIDPFKVDESKTYGVEMDNLPTAYSTEEDYQSVLKRFKKEIDTAKVFVIRAYSYEVAKLVYDDLYDFIYIDSDHTFEGVKRDLNDWLPKMKGTGVIAGHDHISAFDFGVVEAVGDFAIEHDYEMFLLNTHGGDWALKKKAT